MHLPITNFNTIVWWDDFNKEKQLHEGGNHSGEPWNHVKEDFIYCYLKEDFKKCQDAGLDIHTSYGWYQLANWQY